MSAVHVGIGHDNDFVITKLRDIEVIAVSFGKTAAESINHGLNLGIGKDFIYAGFLYV